MRGRRPPWARDRSSGGADSARPEPVGSRVALRSWRRELTGQALAHYRITAAVGAGGMGEVFRATDTKLGREVAIKVLQAEVAGDAERLARFEREARLLAALNHPGIAHVYGFESAALSGRLGRPFSRDGAGPGGGPRGAAEARGAPRRRGGRHREAGRRGARRSPREGHGPPRPQARFDAADPSSGMSGNDYDVAADGRRLLVVRRGAAAAARSMVLVQSWLAEFQGPGGR